MALEDEVLILKKKLNSSHRLISWVFPWRLLSGEYHRTHSWEEVNIGSGNEWLGAVRQQAITCTNVDPDLFHYMVPLGHKELTHLDKMADILQTTFTNVFIQIKFWYF